MRLTSEEQATDYRTHYAHTESTQANLGIELKTIERQIGELLLVGDVKAKADVARLSARRLVIETEQADLRRVAAVLTTDLDAWDTQAVTRGHAVVLTALDATLAEARQVEREYADAIVTAFTLADRLLDLQKQYNAHFPAAYHAGRRISRADAPRQPFGLRLELDELRRDPRTLARRWLGEVIPRVPRPRIPFLLPKTLAARPELDSITYIYRPEEASLAGMGAGLEAPRY